MSDYPFFHEAPPSGFEKARLLRKTMTRAEKHLWKYLRRNQLNGLRFRRQHPVKFFILDFYCHDAKLAVEVDGVGHREKAQQEYDQKRDSEINEMGIKVIRFTNEEVFNNIDSVLNQIMDCAKQQFTASTAPSPTWGGPGRGMQ
jgi:very-short-patch-repair endonuclease